MKNQLSITPLRHFFSSPLPWFLAVVILFSPIDVDAQTVSLSAVCTSPCNVPATVTLTATATAPTGKAISKVEFYDGTTLLSTDTTSPYSYTASNVAGGAHSYTAKAFDNSATPISATSTAQSVTVNSPPTVTLAASCGATPCVAPATVSLTATVSDNTGISKVEFYRGTTLLSTKTASPWTHTDNAVVAGTQSYTAKAFDNATTALSTTSAAQSIIVNALPTVTLSAACTAPCNAPGTVTLTATATAPTGKAISKVEFYDGTTLLSTDTTSPYSFTASNVAGGAHSYTAKAFDNSATPISATSTVQSVTVNSPPTVTLAASCGATPCVAPATVALTATVSDNTGISKVEFYRGATLLSTKTASPWTHTDSAVVAGTQSYTAKAFDNATTALSTTSAAQSIIVNALPTVTLNAACTAPCNAPATVTLTATATAPTGKAISKVEFYDGATLLSTDTTSPYSFTASNVAGGAHSYTAKAFDNSATPISATSTAQSVTVNIANLPPTVTFTVTCSATPCLAPATISLSATATDPDGAISKVEFYRGATLLATKTAAPWTHTDSAVAVGTQTYSAKAFDSAPTPLSTTSTTQSVLVDALPTISLTATCTAPCTSPAALTLAATASSVNGKTITKVEFYDGATLLSTDTSAPFSFSATSVTAGSHSYTAKAFDSAPTPLTNTSSAQTVTVGSANAPPTVSLTATCAAPCVAPSIVSLLANPADSDGTISKVEFYRATTLIATVTAAPWRFDDSVAAAGTVTYSAKAFDNATTPASATSATQTVVVNSSPPQNADATISVNCRAPCDLPATVSVVVNASAITFGSSWELLRDGVVVSTAPFRKIPTGSTSYTPGYVQFLDTVTAAGSFKYKVRATGSTVLESIEMSAQAPSSANDASASFSNLAIGFAAGILGSNSGTVTGTVAKAGTGAGIKSIFLTTIISGDPVIVRPVATVNYGTAVASASLQLKDNNVSSNGFYRARVVVLDAKGDLSESAVVGGAAGYASPVALATGDVGVAITGGYAFGARPSFTLNLAAGQLVRVLYSDGNSVSFTLVAADGSEVALENFSNSGGVVVAPQAGAYTLYPWNLPQGASNFRLIVLPASSVAATLDGPAAVLTTQYAGQPLVVTYPGVAGLEVSAAFTDLVATPSMVADGSIYFFGGKSPAWRFAPISSGLGDHGPVANVIKSVVSGPQSLVLIPPYDTLLSAKATVANLASVALTEGGVTIPLDARLDPHVQQFSVSSSPANPTILGITGFLDAPPKGRIDVLRPDGTTVCSVEGNTLNNGLGYAATGFTTTLLNGSLYCALPSNSADYRVRALNWPGFGLSQLKAKAFAVASLPSVKVTSIVPNQWVYEKELPLAATTQNLPTSQSVCYYTQGYGRQLAGCTAHPYLGLASVVVGVGCDGYGCTPISTLNANVVTSEGFHFSSTPVAYKLSQLGEFRGAGFELPVFAEIGSDVQIQTSGGLLGVSGSFRSSPGVSILVNNHEATKVGMGGRFFVNNDLIDPLATSVEIRAIASDGTAVGATQNVPMPSASGQSLTDQAKAAPVDLGFRVFADKESGVVPFYSIVTIVSTKNTPFQRIEFDFMNDKVIEETVTTLDAKGRYSLGLSIGNVGVFPLKVTVFDAANAIIYERIVYFAGQGNHATVQSILASYSLFISHLETDPTKAKQLFLLSARAKYEPLIDRLTNLGKNAEVALAMKTVGKVTLVGENLAELEVDRVISSTEAVVQFVLMSRDTDGIWRIVEM